MIKVYKHAGKALGFLSFEIERYDKRYELINEISTEVYFKINDVFFNKIRWITRSYLFIT